MIEVSTFRAYLDSNDATQVEGNERTSKAELAGSAHAVDDGRWPHLFLYSRGRTIAAGTSEVQRNIVAQRVLGLPR